MERTNAQRTKDPERLAALLDRQHLVVAVWQMQRCGYSEWAARRAVKTREFDRIHRGVLTVAGTATSASRATAWPPCSPAAPTPPSATTLPRLSGTCDPFPQTAIDVTAPGKRRYDGIRIHVSPLPRQHRTHIDAIPITTLERTYLDYAEQATPRQLTAALEAAQQRQILDLRKLQFVIDNSPGRKGIKSLTAAIEDIDSDPQWTQSRPEHDFLELLRTTDLPQPLANRLDRRPPRRLRLARPTPHRRGRQLRLSHQSRGLRGRPRPRRPPANGRLARPAGHRATVTNPPAGGRRGRAPDAQPIGSSPTCAPSRSPTSPAPPAPSPSPTTFPSRRGSTP